MHPWVWLNEPQHAAAVQAVTSLVYTSLTAAAAYFALGAFIAARRQADVAAEQTQLAREQTALARATAEAEREYANTQTRIANAQVKEQYRPVIAVNRDTREGTALDSEQIYILRNQGSGTAKNILIQSFVENEGIVTDVGEVWAFPNSSLPVQRIVYLNSGLEFGLAFNVFYESAMGDRYATRCEVVEGTVEITSFVDDPGNWPLGY